MGVITTKPRNTMKKFALIFAFAATVVAANAQCDHEYMNDPLIQIFLKDRGEKVSSGVGLKPTNQESDIRAEVSFLLADILHQEGGPVGRSYNPLDTISREMVKFWAIPYWAKDGGFYGYASGRTDYDRRLDAADTSNATVKWLSDHPGSMMIRFGYHQCGPKDIRIIESGIDGEVSVTTVSGRDAPIDEMRSVLRNHLGKKRGGSVHVQYRAAYRWVASNRDYPVTGCAIDVLYLPNPEQ